jgi:hypothetical protein
MDVSVVKIFLVVRTSSIVTCDKKVRRWLLPRPLSIRPHHRLTCTGAGPGK